MMHSSPRHLIICIYAIWHKDWQHRSNLFPWQSGEARAAKVIQERTNWNSCTWHMFLRLWSQNLPLHWIRLISLILDISWWYFLTGSYSNCKESSTTCWVFAKFLWQVLGWGDGGLGCVGIQILPLQGFFISYHQQQYSPRPLGRPISLPLSTALPNILKVQLDMFRNLRLYSTPS